MDYYIRKCLPYLKKPFKNLNWLHCHPYHWSVKNNGPAIRGSSWVRMHWYFNAALTIGYYIFVLCRTLQIYVDGSKSLEEKFYMAISTLLYQCFTMFQVSALMRRDELVPFLKGYIEFLRGQLDTTGESTYAAVSPTGLSQGSVGLCRLLMCAVYYTTRMNIILIPLLTFLRPASPEYVSSLFISKPHGNSLARWASVSLQMYIMICYGQVMALCSGPVVLFMFSMHHVMTLSM